MMPHLGVLSTINEKAATDVFVRDCMIYLGTCVAPIGQGKDGDVCADYEIIWPDGKTTTDQLKFGELRLFPLDSGKQATIKVHPVKGVSMGAGAGVAVTKEVHGGVVGLLLDGRGRPLRLPAEQQARVAALTKWFTPSDLYPVVSAEAMSAEVRFQKTLPHSGRSTRNSGLYLVWRIVILQASLLRIDTVVHRRRMLPLPGTVVVNVGDQVRSDQVVAKAELPGKVFPVNLANQLSVAPGEIKDYLVKKEGDVVQKDEILAENKPLIKWFKTEIRSPVTGRIESRVDGHGTSPVAGTSHEFSSCWLTWTARSSKRFHSRESSLRRLQLGARHLRHRR